MNRSGLTVGLRQCVADAVGRVDAKAVLFDGKAVGDAYYAFDLLEHNGVDLRNGPYDQRYAALVELVNPLKSERVRGAETAVGKRDKRLSLTSSKLRSGRGWCSRTVSPRTHTHGRPASGAVSSN